MMEGRLEVESTLGRGSRFTLVIPTRFCQEQPEDAGFDRAA
jgi:signal transduction histidine kinase